MLVLTRKPDEQIVIDVTGPCQIVLTVVEVRGDKTRIGLDGPKERATFHRREVHDAITKS